VPFPFNRAPTLAAFYLAMLSSVGSQTVTSIRFQGTNRFGFLTSANFWIEVGPTAVVGVGGATVGGGFAVSLWLARDQ
jgi:hypothetical protein